MLWRGGPSKVGTTLSGDLDGTLMDFQWYVLFMLKQRYLARSVHLWVQEFEIDKTLGIKGPADIMEMGIDKYNAECRKIVMRYSEEWEKTVNRMGRFAYYFLVPVWLVLGTL